MIIQTSYIDENSNEKIEVTVEFNYSLNGITYALEEFELWEVKTIEINEDEVIVLNDLDYGEEVQGKLVAKCHKWIENDRNNI